MNRVQKSILLKAQENKDSDEKFYDIMDWVLCMYTAPYINDYRRRVNVYHACKNKNQFGFVDADKCNMCGTIVPRNIKMHVKLRALEI
jgi:hypothetical protein